jgi:hypothetical protein
LREPVHRNCRSSKEFVAKSAYAKTNAKPLPKILKLNLVALALKLLTTTELERTSNITH